MRHIRDFTFGGKVTSFGLSMRAPCLRVSASTFARLSPFVIRTLCGPSLQASDNCLISLKTPDELWNAVEASDGRVYDAVSLGHWLKYRNDVIPTQQITDVNVCIWPVWCALQGGRSFWSIAWRTARFTHDRFLQRLRRRAIQWKKPNTPKSHTPPLVPRSHMLCQIIKNHHHRKSRTAMRNARRLVISDTSAFERLSPRT